MIPRTIDRFDSAFAWWLTVILLPVLGGPPWAFTITREPRRADAFSPSSSKRRNSALLGSPV
jgi:hypothetical protein